MNNKKRKLDPDHFRFLDEARYSDLENIRPDVEPIVISTDQIKLTRSLPFSMLHGPMCFIAMQQDLNLEYVKDFQKITHILCKSIILN